MKAQTKRQLNKNCTDGFLIDKISDYVIDIDESLSKLLALSRLLKGDEQKEFTTLAHVLEHDVDQFREAIAEVNINDDEEIIN